MKCPKCGKESKWLTKHSLIGNHQPPFVWMCRICHDKEHGIKANYKRRSQRGTSGKYKKGTRRQKRK